MLCQRQLKLKTAKTACPLPPAEAAEGGGEEQPDQEAEEPAEEVQPAEEAAPSAPSAASGLAGQEPMPVEQFDWSTLKKLPANYCGSCRMPVEADPTKRVTKKGHATLSCKTCHNVTSMLYKRINMQTVGFKDIPPAQAWVLQNAFAKVSVFQKGHKWFETKGFKTAID